MKILISCPIILVSIGFLCACRPASNQAIQTKQPPVQDRREKRILDEEDLAKLIRVGMSKEDVVKTFGDPNLDPMDLGDGLTRWGYLFDVDEKTAPSDSFVSGVTVYIKDGKVLRWAPSYTSGSWEDEWVAVQPKGETSSRDRPGVEPISLWLVSTNENEGGRFVNTVRFPELGYIPNQPVLTLKRLKFLEEGKQGKWSTLRLTLIDDDAAAFKKLTEENIGKRTLVTLGDKPLVAPYISDPISSGTIHIPCDEAREFAELRDKIARLLVSKRTP